jgi:hypothetical protein
MAHGFPPFDPRWYHVPEYTPKEMGYLWIGWEPQALSDPPPVVMAMVRALANEFPFAEKFVSTSAVYSNAGHGSRPEQVAPTLEELRRYAEKIGQRPAILYPDDQSVVANDPAELSTREKTSYLNIIGALLQEVVDKKATFDSHAALIKHLVVYLDGSQGISKPNLEKRFTEAKRSLSDSFKK